ncbi:MAG: winged helix-turn-helix transcriptional regulator [Thermoplasmatota archaeon]
MTNRPLAKETHTRRTYGQFCGVARGLDIIGERWTLLVIRELLLGPKRYKDLLDALPGIGTNLLAARLRELEEVGVLRHRELPPPAGSSVYELTEVGQGLEPILIALGRWGARFLGSPQEADTMSPGAYFVAMRARFRPELAQNESFSYEFRVDGRVFEVTVRDGKLRTMEAPPPQPDAILTMSVETLHALFFGLTTPAQAIAKGKVALQGAKNALDTFVRIFPRPLVAKVARVP